MYSEACHAMMSCHKILSVRVEVSIRDENEDEVEVVVEGKGRETNREDSSLWSLWSCQS